MSLFTQLAVLFDAQFGVHGLLSHYFWNRGRIDGEQISVYITLKLKIPS